MDKIRGNPHAIALAHPTRAQLYSALCTTEEMSTVELEKAVGVTRYHLYHHLAQLAKLDLVENHRDVGRAKWWRAGPQVAPAMATGGAVSLPGPSQSDGVTAPAWSDDLPAEMVRMLELGAKVEFLPLPKGGGKFDFGQESAEKDSPGIRHRLGYTVHLRPRRHCSDIATALSEGAKRK